MKVVVGVAVVVAVVVVVVVGVDVGEAEKTISWERRKIGRCRRDFDLSWHFPKLDDRQKFVIVDLFKIATIPSYFWIYFSYCDTFKKN